ncbi:MAG: hypothetical protein GWO20_15100 [Candidatus Korarchaeota archaeon]|nr:hypothetical protein [Candidatus Korarchaeota archaeon]NIU83744.1 hypothetical protein [Candidatus Thorarchaeota archaeon]NIW15697.1 hypothetical protein [Candidatus Thorarchaeota archaeon]NIW52061.1 hypothetical protein [Candidatus Korarchaeota archaeon]
MGDTPHGGCEKRGDYDTCVYLDGDFYEVDVMRWFMQQDLSLVVCVPKSKWTKQWIDKFNAAGSKDKLHTIEHKMQGRGKERDLPVTFKWMEHERGNRGVVGAGVLGCRDWCDYPLLEAMGNRDRLQVCKTVPFMNEQSLSGV